MLPFGRGAYASRGDRVTVVTWGATVHRARLAAQALGRQALHAATLAFPHPITGVRIACEAPLPDDFALALRILGIV
jgi:23S rRNA-/tRNA-specific pseudouridylate synthase